MLRLSTSEISYILSCVNLTHHLVTVLEDEPSSTRTFLLEEVRNCEELIDESECVNSASVSAEPPPR